MSAKVVTLEIDVNSGNSAQEVKKISNAFDALDDNAAKSSGKIGNAFDTLNTKSAAVAGFVGGMVGGAVAQLSAQFGQGIQAVITYQRQMESLSSSFIHLMGNAKLAQAHLNELQNFSNSTPLEMDFLTSASKDFQRFKTESKDIIPLITDIANVGYGVGASASEVESVTDAFISIKKEGTASLSALEGIASSGIPVWKMLSVQFGESEESVKKLAKEGVISANLFTQAFQTASRTDFAGEMAKQSNTFDVAMKNIKQAILSGAAKMFQPVYDEISAIAVNASKQIEGLNFNASLKVLASSVAQAFGVYLKNEIASFDWNNIITPADIGASIAYGLNNGKDIWGNQMQKPKFLQETSQIDAVPVQQTASAVKDVANNTQQVKSLKEQLQADKAAADLVKTREIALDLATKIRFFGDNTEVAAAKQQFLSKGITDWTSAGARGVLSLAATLDKLKQFEPIHQLIKDLRVEIAFFGNDTKEAAVKQKLFEQGITDYSSATAKYAISLAQQYDAVKKLKEAEADRAEKLKSSREEIARMREQAAFKLEFPNATEMDTFNYRLRQITQNFKELSLEAALAKAEMQGAVAVEKINNALKQSEGFVKNLRASIGQVTNKELSPFAAKVKELVGNTELFSANGMKIDSGEFGANVAKFIADQKEMFNALKDSPDVASLWDVALKGWFEKFGAFLGDIKQKVETDGEIKFIDFFDMKNGLNPLIADFLSLDNAFEKLNQKAADKTYSRSMDELNAKSIESGNSSEFVRMKKALETDAYKNLNEEQRKNLLLKAQEVDTNLRFNGLNKGLDEQIESARRGGKELAEYDKTVREIQKTIKGGINLTDDQQKTILDKAAIVDYQNELKKAYGAVESFVQRTTGAIRENGVKGLFKSIRDEFTNMLTKMAQDLITSKIFKLIFGKDALSSIGKENGGNSVFGNIAGLFGRGAPGGTPTFQPSSVIGRIGSFFGLGGGGAASSASSGIMANSIGGTVANTIPLAGGGLFTAGATSAGAGVAGGAAGAAGAGAGGLSGMIGSMGAFMTNPWTIGIAAAAIGAFALWKTFGGENTLKKIREAIKSTYGVDIKDKNILKQLRDLGISRYGKKGLMSNINNLIALDESKEIIKNYADATGQDSGRITLKGDLTDENFRGNIFSARGDGRDGISASGNSSSNIFSSAASSSSSSSVAGRGDSSASPMMAVLGALTETVNNLQAKLSSMSPGEVVTVAAESNPEAFYSPILAAADRNATMNEKFNQRANLNY